MYSRRSQVSEEPEDWIFQCMKWIRKLTGLTTNKKYYFYYQAIEMGNTVSKWCMQRFKRFLKQGNVTWKNEFIY